MKVMHPTSLLAMSSMYIMLSDIMLGMFFIQHVKNMHWVYQGSLPHQSFMGLITEVCLQDKGLSLWEEQEKYEARRGHLLPALLGTFALPRIVQVILILNYITTMKISSLHMNTICHHLHMLHQQKVKDHLENNVEVKR